MTIIKTLKSVGAILLLFAFCALLLQCSSDMPNNNKTDSSSIVLNISVTQPCLEIIPSLDKSSTIQKVIVTVTASGMSTITRELTGSGDTWSGDISVPQGKARTFLVEAKDANNIAQYSGSTTRDLTQTAETIDIELVAQYPTAVTLSLGAVTASSITINWTQSTDADFDHYTITRKSTSGNHDLNQDRLTQIRTGVSSTTYTDTDVTEGTPYYYQVWVVDTESLGRTSNQVNATPSAQQVFEFTVNNTALTDIIFTVNGKGTITIETGTFETISFSSNPGSITYSAYTSGKTTGGTVIGEVLNWTEKTIDVSTVSAYTLTLYVTSSYFMLYFTNSGYDDVNIIYVNYGLTTQQIEDSFVLPADNVKYRLGYYAAETNSNVWAHYETADVWNYFYQGTDFTIPFTDNQSVHITLVWEAQQNYTGKKVLDKKTPPSCQLIEAGALQGNYKNINSSVFVGCK
ncbi:MAG TPA: fibronectin type III domain-containing protein [bacterium]|nr:fibronectin type III domain-containing protein [bacterium]HPN43473.1 fibronectin type III domain-containing protein [bacterium]